MSMDDACSPNAASRTAELHSLHRGAAELTKVLRRIALAMDISAGVLAAWGATTGRSPWQPLAALFLLLVGAVLRFYGRSTYGFSEKCRRLSVRSYSLGKTINAATFSSLTADEPPLARKLAARLSRASMDEYYEPTRGVGRNRLREIYAYSSFFSWRLLRAEERLLALVLLGFLGCGALIVFYVAVERIEVSTTTAILEVICSLVFGVLALKTLDRAMTCHIVARESRQVTDELVGVHGVTEERLADLLSLYDSALASGLPPSTVLYKILGRRLDAEWRQRRQALDESGLDSRPRRQDEPTTVIDTRLEKEIDDLVDLLARVAHGADQARIIVRRAGFLAAHVPEFKTALEFWSEVVEQARNGRIEFGLERLVEAAIRQFPHNQELLAYCRKVRVASESVNADPT
jgi:hypothetical protein